MSFKNRDTADQKRHLSPAAVFGGLLAPGVTSLCHEHINLVLQEHDPKHDNQARLDMVLRFTHPARVKETGMGRWIA